GRRQVWNCRGMVPACLSRCLPACLSRCLPACLSRCLPACLSRCLPACLSRCLPVCLAGDTQKNIAANVGPATETDLEDTQRNIRSELYNTNPIVSLVLEWRYTGLSTFLVLLASSLNSVCRLYKGKVAMCMAVCVCPTCQHGQCGGLPGSVVPQQNCDLALEHVHRQILDSLPCLVSHFELLAG
uniref:Uncharacterized protein n=1 Tax=Hucho hucho TaxID=62062 RepID=A0A4W5QJK7_9TELE